MSWARIDDTLCDHPKVLAAGLEAMGLWVMALTYCSRHLTDGKVSQATFCYLVANRQTDFAIAERLVFAKLWEVAPDGDGWVFHDYHDYNPSKADAKRKRADLSAIRSEAGRRGAEKRWANRDSKPDGKASGNLPSDGKWQTHAPVPSRPVPISPPNPLRGDLGPIDLGAVPEDVADFERGISLVTGSPCKLDPGGRKSATFAELFALIPRTSGDRGAELRAAGERCARWALSRKASGVTLAKLGEWLNAGRPSAETAKNKPVADTPPAPYHATTERKDWRNTESDSERDERHRRLSARRSKLDRPEGPQTHEGANGSKAPSEAGSRAGAGKVPEQPAAVLDAEELSALKAADTKARERAKEAT